MEGNTRKRRWTWLPLIGLAAVLAFVVISQPGKHLDLMEHVERVPGYATIGGVLAGECRWTSPTTVEVIDSTNNISIVDLRTGSLVTRSGKLGDQSASDW